MEWVKFAAKNEKALGKANDPAYSCLKEGTSLSILVINNSSRSRLYDFRVYFIQRLLFCFIARIFKP